MGKFVHLIPRERQEIVDNIVEKLKPELEKYVKEVVGTFAITETEVAETLDKEFKTKLKPRWLTRLFFRGIK